jgi:hypothetical protein
MHGLLTQAVYQQQSFNNARLHIQRNADLACAPAQPVQTLNLREHVIRH